MRVLSIDDSLLPTNVAVRKRCNVFWKRCSMFQKLCNVFQKNVGMRSNNAEMRSWIRCGLNLVHPRFSFILYNFGFTYMLFSRFRIYFWGGHCVLWIPRACSHIVFLCETTYVQMCDMFIVDFHLFCLFGEGRWG